MVYLLFFEILRRSAGEDGATKAPRYLQSIQVLGVVLIFFWELARYVLRSYYLAVLPSVLWSTWILVAGVYTLLSYRDWSRQWSSSAETEHRRF